MKKIVEKLVVDATVGLIKKVWNKWKNSRKQLGKSNNVSLIIGKTEERSVDGKIKRINRLEVRGALEPEQIGQYIAETLDEWAMT